MGLLKHATVEGINAALEERGRVRWPSTKVAEEVCHAVARRLGGPERLDNGLSPGTARKIAAEIEAFHAGLVARGMKSPDPVYAVKAASERHLPDYAYERAAACMRKHAGAGSLTGVGENTPESAATDDQHAKLDQENRSTGEYVVGVGNTQMPSGGEVGKQMPHPQAPASSPAVSNSVTKAAAFERKLAALKLTREKLAHLMVHGKSPALRAEAAKLAAEGLLADKTAAAAAPTKGPFPGAAPPFGKKDPKGTKQANLPPELMGAGGGMPPDMGGMGGGMPPDMGGMGGGMGGEADIDALADAIASAGVDPDAITPDDVMQALSQAQMGDPGGTPAGAESPAPSPPPKKDSDGGSDDGEKSKSKDSGGSDDEESKKEAALLAEIQKLASGDGSLTDVDNNTPESAAKTDQVSKLDQENRSTNEYVVPQGKSSLGDNGEGQVKDVQPAPNAPKTNPDTTPARETKTAEELEYQAALTKLAQMYAGKLPAAMPKATKVAHLQKLLALHPAQRAGYIQGLKG